MGFGCLSPLPSCSATRLLGPAKMWGRTAVQFTEHEKNRANIFSLRHRFPDFGSLGIGWPLSSLSNLFSMTCVVLSTYFWDLVLFYFEIL